VRFYWKKESAVGGTKAGKAKILRSVLFPKVLDLYNFCSDSLKQKLDKGRALDQKQREVEDKEILEGKKALAEENDKMAKGLEEAQTQEEKEQKRIVGKMAKIKQQEE
jgi:ubiquitin carboxyl-terminal hydrolase 14